MLFREMARGILGLPPHEIARPDPVSFREATVRTILRHYLLTEPAFDGTHWHQVPARFLRFSGSYCLDARSCPATEERE